MIAGHRYDVLSAFPNDFQEVQVGIADLLDDPRRALRHMTLERTS